jgi:predicted MFS family arabinose efflux permease
MGYVFGALIAGAAADALGYGGAIAIVAALTAASGLWVLRDMPPHHRRTHTTPRPIGPPRPIDPAGTRSAGTHPDAP